MLALAAACVALSLPENPLRQGGRLFRRGSRAPVDTHHPDVPLEIHAAQHTVEELLAAPSTTAIPPLHPASPASMHVILPELTHEDRDTLLSGGMMLKIMEDTAHNANEGVAAQMVNAPSEVVWETILDFDEWPRMIDDVVATEVYEPSNGKDLKVKVTLGIAFLRIKTWVWHVFDRGSGTLTWSLDESKQSDVISNTGFWVVREDGDGKSCTVYYSCAITLRTWAPRFLDRYVAKEGLPRALGWLKREAESRMESREQAAHVGV